MAHQFQIEWIDGNREPKEKPDPDYPHGIDLNMSMGRSPSCYIALPYPAPRCGMFYVECKRCGTNILLTTAGRLDDPRSITLACDLKSMQS